MSDSPPEEDTIGEQPPAPDTGDSGAAATDLALLARIGQAGAADTWRTCKSIVSTLWRDAGKLVAAIYGLGLAIRSGYAWLLDGPVTPGLDMQNFLAGLAFVGGPACLASLLLVGWLVGELVGAALIGICSDPEIHMPLAMLTCLAPVAVFGDVPHDGFVLGTVFHIGLLCLLSYGFGLYWRLRDSIVEVAGKWLSAGSLAFVTLVTPPFTIIIFLLAAVGGMALFLIMPQDLGGGRPSCGRLDVSVEHLSRRMQFRLIDPTVPTTQSGVATTHPLAVFGAGETWSVKPFDKGLDTASYSLNGTLVKSVSWCTEAEADELQKATFALLLERLVPKSWMKQAP